MVYDQSELQDSAVAVKRWCADGNNLTPASLD